MTWIWSRGQPRRVLITDGNIHKTRVSTLSAEELGIMSKNHVRGIYLGIAAPCLSYFLDLYKYDYLSVLHPYVQSSGSCKRCTRLRLIYPKPIKTFCERDFFENLLISLRRSVHCLNLNILNPLPLFRHKLKQFSEVFLFIYIA